MSAVEQYRRAQEVRDAAWQAMVHGPESERATARIVYDAAHKLVLLAAAALRAERHLTVLSPTSQPAACNGVLGASPGTPPGIGLGGGSSHGATLPAPGAPAVCSDAAGAVPSSEAP